MKSGRGGTKDVVHSIEVTLASKLLALVRFSKSNKKQIVASNLFAVVRFTKFNLTRNHISMHENAHCA